MARTGPIPNRSDDLSRERDANRGDRSPVSKGVALPFEWPMMNPEWNEVAMRIWKGAQESGQSAYYQASDVAMLYMMCDEITAYSEPTPVFNKRTGEPVIDEVTGRQVTVTHRSPMMLTSIMSGLSSLLLTEGERRRVRIELEAETTEDDAEVVAIDGYRAALGVVK